MSVKTKAPLIRETAEREVSKPPFGAPHVMVLAVVEGDDNGLAYRINQAQTVIGRGDVADIQVIDDEVSKRQCTIRVEGSVISLVDLGSLNGTLINGRPMRAEVIQRLRHMDEIQIGNTRLLFLSGRFRDRPKRV